MKGHLTVQLRIHGDDMWIKDNVDLFVREIRQNATSFDTLNWQEDASWTYVATWSKDIAMSTDSDEGYKTVNMNLCAAFGGGGFLKGRA